jgi:hypothetical protein
MEPREPPSRRKDGGKSAKLLASEDHDMEKEDPTTKLELAFFPLTEKCHHYIRRTEVDWDIQKLDSPPCSQLNSNLQLDTGINGTAYFRSTMREFI